MFVRMLLFIMNLDQLPAAKKGHLFKINPNKELILLILSGLKLWEENSEKHVPFHCQGHKEILEKSTKSLNM